MARRLRPGSARPGWVGRRGCAGGGAWLGRRGWAGGGAWPGGGAAAPRLRARGRRAGGRGRRGRASGRGARAAGSGGVRGDGGERPQQCSAGAPSRWRASVDDPSEETAKCGGKEEEEGGGLYTRTSLVPVGGSNRD
jgi:hypothetical protein